LDQPPPPSPNTSTPPCPSPKIPTPPSPSPKISTTAPSGFFDRESVEYPSDHAYPPSYTTRTLLPVKGYHAGSPGFVNVDISANTVSFLWGSGEFRGGVLAPNGKVVFVSHSAQIVGVFDPATNAFSGVDIPVIGRNYLDSSKYSGGALAPNGKIYFVPYRAKNVGVCDPVTSAFSVVDLPGRSTSEDDDFGYDGFGAYSGGLYSGGVLGPNGKIYFVPFEADNVGVFDPATDAFSVVDVSGTGWFTLGKYSGGVLAPNGKIYFVPHDTNNVGVFDPATNKFSVVDIPARGWFDLEKYSGGVLSPDGRIIFAPTRGRRVGVFDPVTNTLSSIGISKDVDMFDFDWDPTDQNYHGGVQAPNGKIYFLPHDGNAVGIFDPATKSFTAVKAYRSSSFSDLVLGSHPRYAEGVLAPDGKVVLVPNQAQNVGVVNTGNSTPAYTVSGGIPKEWWALLSPFFNKF